MPGFAAIFATTVLFSLSQLKACGPGPSETYQRFTRKVEKGKCASVYRALDATSQARLDAYLQSMVEFAITVEQHAYGEDTPPPEASPQAPDKAPPPLYQPGTLAAAVDGDDRKAPATLDGGAAATDGSPEDGEGTASSEDETEKTAEAVANAEAENHRRRILNHLSTLSGKALFKRLCQPAIPPLAYLFRETGLEDFQALDVAEEKIEGDLATLSAAAPKGSKEKGATVQLRKEGKRWRVVLEPMAIHWYTMDDGRVVPRFKSPLLSLGVEVDAERTPTEAYNRLVEYVRKGRCESFYDMLDSESQERIGRVGPMMVGLASAVGANTGDNPQARDGRSLLIQLCKRASLSELRASGFYLGEVVDEQVANREAALSVRSRGTTEPREVLMVRDLGQWRMSIEPFAGLVTMDDETLFAADKDLPDEDEDEN